MHLESILYSCFRNGPLLDQPVVDPTGLPTVIRRMLSTMKETTYWSAGKELERSTEDEVIELMKAISVLEDSVIIRIALVCATGEGYGEITSIENIGVILSRLAFFCFLQHHITRVGYKPDFMQFSVFDDERKVFKNLRLIDFQGKTPNELEDMINKELY